MRTGFEGVNILGHQIHQDLSNPPHRRPSVRSTHSPKIGQCRLTEVLILGSCPVCDGDTFPLVYPHVLGEGQIQPAEPDELGLMPQGGDHSSTVFFYPCDKHRSDREDRVAVI
jgi:hypothetical protein